MIIYPHGCRILHRLLRDVAATISSYGLHVHLALLESSKLDSTGGISRFYEETITNSSYTLVLCTETSGNLTILCYLESLIETSCLVVSPQVSKLLFVCCFVCKFSFTKVMIFTAIFFFN